MWIICLSYFLSKKKYVYFRIPSSQLRFALLGLNKLLVIFNHCHDKCPKISYTKLYDKTARADPAPKMLLKEQSDQGLSCLLYH